MSERRVHLGAVLPQSLKDRVKREKPKNLSLSRYVERLLADKHPAKVEAKS